MREKRKILVECFLQNINKPIWVSSSEITNVIPEEVMKSLPTEELNLHIDIQEE